MLFDTADSTAQTNKESQSMIEKTSYIAMILATVALVGCGGSKGLIHHFHGGGHGDRHCEHQQEAIAEVIEQLKLTPEQNQRLEKIHEAFDAYHGAGHGDMGEIHDRLVEQFEQGDLDAEKMRGLVDAHLDEMRDVAYGVADELALLINSLDATQHETLTEHLQERGHSGHDAHGD